MWRRRNQERVLRSLLSRIEMASKPTGDTVAELLVCVRGLAINWVEDVAEIQHDDPALAIFGALVQAQLRKLQGSAPSNVTPFRWIKRPGASRLSRDTKR
jgi:hypothetical protein